MVRFDRGQIGFCIVALCYHPVHPDGNAPKMRAITMPVTDSAPASPRKERIISLDAARAIVVALMIFMGHPMIITALPDFLVHPEWHGFRIADFVFPAFIFLAGVSLAYSVSAKNSFSIPAATPGFLRRIGVLFGIGLALNFMKYSVRMTAGTLSFAPLRYLGVLQKIALSLLIAWPFTRSRKRVVLSVAALLLLIHGAVLLLVAAPGMSAGYLESPTDNIAAWIDRTVMGVSHTYLGRGYDPEGILGTLSSGAQALLGLFVGQWLLAHAGDRKKVLQLAMIGATWALLGIAGAALLPINKQLWTPTFTLLSSGIATVALVAIFWVADLSRHRKPFEWLVPMGRNALLIYICSNILLLVGRTTGFFPNAGIWLSGYIPAAAASLFFSLAEVTMWFLLAGWLHRRKIYFKF